MTTPSEFNPDWFSPPSESIRYLLRQKAVPAHHLASHMHGGAETLRGLFDGTVTIDRAIAKSLTNVLGGTECFWLTRQTTYENALERITQLTSDKHVDDWLAQIPTPGPKPRGRMTATRRVTELRRRLVFYNVANLRSWNKRYGTFGSTTLFRKSSAYRANTGPVSMWLRLGELESDMVTTRSWNAENLRDRLPSIRKLCRVGRPTRFLPRLRALFSESGVAMTVVPSPQGCPASGATKWLSPDKAMILMSFRYRTDDQFWFTLFHEIGHLMLHETGTFVDGDLTLPEGPFETEANDFARDCIIPAERRSEFEDLPHDYRSVVRFSVSVNISPGLAVGQLQHEGQIEYDRLNFLKRRWTWNEIASAGN